MADRLEEQKAYPDDPVGWAKRWAVEMESAQHEIEVWHDQGDKVVKRYLDERDAETKGESRLNLFHGDVETKKALLYGNPPRVRSRRRYADADDDVARVSAEMQERLLNCDIERDDDGYETALEYARDDRLLAGLGVLRMRYTVEMEDVPERPAQMGPCPECRGTGMMGGAPAGAPGMIPPGMPLGAPPGPGMMPPGMPPQGAMPPPGMQPGMPPAPSPGMCPSCGGTGTRELAPAVPAGQKKAEEDVATDYIHWKDYRWSPSRFWSEVRWEAFRAQMTRKALHERFDESLGADIVQTIPLNSKRRSTDDRATDPWSRADVWEIWSKEHGEVFWWVEGFHTILDRKADPLGLEGFWPNARPLFANTTTSKLLPVPDFCIAQDIYDEIDTLSTRINLLEDAIRVSGIYDSQQPELAQLVGGSGPARNRMIPVANWAMLAEKGGLKGTVDWFPFETVANVLGILGQKRTEKIALLYQVTGMSDIIRGQATGSATATEQRIKARAASTRTQLAQNEFAKFAQDSQRIRAEIIAKHFDVQTIVERSNILHTADAELATQAAQLLKDEHAEYRIEIATDALAMTDFDAVKQESTEFLTAVGGFLEQIGQIGMQAPGAVPGLLEMLKVGLAGFRRASTMEGILDKAIKAATAQAAQPKPPPPPDPRMEAVKVKAQTEMQKSQMDLQGAQLEHGFHMQELAAGVQADRAKTQMQVVRAMARPPPAANEEPL